MQFVNLFVKFFISIEEFIGSQKGIFDQLKEFMRS